MNVVYKKDNKKWYLASMFIYQNNLIIDKEERVQSIKDVLNIDEYVDIDKYLEYNTMDFFIKKHLKNMGIIDMYVKFHLPQNALCSSCTKKCKSDNVIRCSEFTSRKRRK